MASSSSKGKGKEIVTKRRRRTMRIQEESEEEMQIAFDDPPASFDSKNFLAGKRILPSHLKGSYVLDFFINQGWIPFMRYKNKVCKLECALFYENLRIVNANLESRVHGINIVLSPQLIARLFNIENRGLAVWFEPTSWPEEYSLKECIEVLVEDISVRSKMASPLPTSRMLSGDNQLVCWFIENNLMPRDRKDGKFNFMVAFFLWKILTGAKMNLPFYIIRHMYAMRKRTGIPYCVHLTKIFEHFKIPIKESETVKHTHNWDATLKNLKTGGLYLTGNRFLSDHEFHALPEGEKKAYKDELVRLNDKRRGYSSVSEDDMEDEMDRPVREAWVPPPDNNAVLAAIQGLQERMDTRFNACDERFAFLEARQLDYHNITQAQLQDLDDRINELSIRMDRMGYPGGSGSRDRDDGSQ